MQFITIDIAHMVKDDNGNRYMLIIGDLFSKYVEAVPLRGHTTEEICNALFNDWILVHGYPNFLLSDHGSNVDGHTIRNVCDNFHIEKRRYSAYHSPGNGFAERSVRNVKEILRLYLHDNNWPQKDWSKFLKELQFALNTSISSATRITPYEVVYGREAITPADVTFGTDQRKLNTDVVTVTDYTAELKIKLKRMYVLVNTNLNHARNKMSATYNKNVYVHTYSEGGGGGIWLQNKRFKPWQNPKLPYGVELEVISVITQPTNFTGFAYFSSNREKISVTSSSQNESSVLILSDKHWRRVKGDSLGYTFGRTVS